MKALRQNAKMTTVMTIRGLLEKWAGDKPNSVALKYCEDKVWKTKSYGEMLRGVREIAEGYGRHFALKPREDNAAVILPNAPSWMEAYLAQCVESVLRTPSLAALEIVIVNDGSTDKESLEVLKRYENDPQIRIVNIKNKGLANGLIFCG